MYAEGAAGNFGWRVIGRRLALDGHLAKWCILRNLPYFEKTTTYRENAYNAFVRKCAK
jgi:hypothetical protein